LTGLERKGIMRPTPIQVQGIPTVWVLIVLDSSLVTHENCWYYVGDYHNSVLVTVSMKSIKKWLL
jgi:hypothetical protein